MTDTQTIKDRVDIVQLIGEYVQLKKSGANWKACCPFHHEKSPSFMVHPEKQIWHCFGCQKGGDIFTFLQEIEGIDFPEALKILADRAGVKIDTFRSEIDKSQKNRILEINSKAAHFFHHFLLEMPVSKMAREYLQKRGLKDQTIEEWKVGFIPEQWDLLTQYLLKKGNSIDDLLASGLAIKKDGADVRSGRGFYDRFRGRIMFPIWDAHGNIVGFTGRILVERENSGGKYVNTPQTLVYDKSRVLYGLDKAKMEIKSKDLVVVVEGQMDVIACHQSGMKNVVASSGTALTLEQIRLLKRYTSNIAMAFDADSAGQNAAKRGVDVALQEGMRVKVIKIPDGAGKDADECLKKNPEIWFKAVSESQDVMDWYIASVLGKTDLHDPRKRQEAANTLVSEVKKIPFPVERDYWMQKVSEKIGVSKDVLREELQRVVKSAENKMPRQGISNAPKTAHVNNAELNKKIVVAENLWAIFLAFPKILAQNFSSLNDDFFADTPHVALYEYIKKEYSTKTFDIDALRAFFSRPSGENIIDVLLLKGETTFNNNETEASNEAGLLLTEMRKEHTKNKRAALSRALMEAEANKNEQKIQEIIKEISALE